MGRKWETLLFVPILSAVGRDCIFLAPERVGLWTACGLLCRGHSAIIWVAVVCTECVQVHTKVTWPGNAQAGIPSPSPGGLQGVSAGPRCLLPTTRKLRSPLVKPRLLGPPEGFVRKEGNAAQLPHADCFPCSCEERGNATSASLLQQGKGRWNRHSALKQRRQHHQPQAWWTHHA